jgi:hypothetical protein
MFFDFLGIPGESMTERFKIFVKMQNRIMAGPLVELFNTFRSRRKELKERK